MIRLSFCLFLLLVSTCSSAFEPCRIKGYAHEVECETYPLDQSSEQLGRQLKVYRVASVVRYPLAEPIVWIPSGLGVDVEHAGVSKMRTLRRVRTHQDLIWLEVLNHDKSKWLSCQSDLESSEQPQNLNSLAQRLDYFADPAFLQSCQQRVSKVGLDVFSPEKLAILYESMRKKLGYKKVVVFADGQGAQVALAWQKIAPQAIQFQVFDNPFVRQKNTMLLSANAVKGRFDKIALACAANSSCQQQYGDITLNLKKIVANLPQQVLIQDPMTGLNETVTVTQALFNRVLSKVLSAPVTASRVPKLLHDVLNGRWQSFFGMAALSWSKRDRTFNDAAFLGQYCWTYQDDLAQAPAASHWFYRMAKQRVKKLCAGISISHVNNQAEVKSMAPTLLLTGEMQTGANIDWQFIKNQTMVRVPNVIGNVLSYGCAKDVMYRYFKWQRHHESPAGMSEEALGADCLANIQLPLMDVLQ